jgi:hypothetical protein
MGWLTLTMSSPFILIIKSNFLNAHLCYNTTILQCLSLGICIIVRYMRLDTTLGRSLTSHPKKSLYDIVILIYFYIDN